MHPSQLSRPHRTAEGAGRAAPAAAAPAVPAPPHPQKPPALRRRHRSRARNSQRYGVAGGGPYGTPPVFLRPSVRLEGGIALAIPKLWAGALRWGLLIP